ncbi:MAG: hypothetical protein ACYTG1_07620, partial [Planctomycetota bacterium]
MSAVLAWVKSNVFTLIFIVLMVAALAVLPILARNMSAAVTKEVQQRADKIKDLERLEKTTFTPPTAGTGTAEQSVLVNASLLERYEEVARALREDADRVLEAALAHNRQGRGVLLDELFPEPPPDFRREVLPERFHELLMDAYERLLREIDAGMPPSGEEMARRIAQRQAQFLTHMAAKESVEDLTDEEKTQLKEELTKERLSRYAEAAEKVGVYASLDELDLPYFDPASPPTLPQMFNWQWQFWMIQDIL